MVSFFTPFLAYDFLKFPKLSESCPTIQGIHEL